MAMLGKYPFTFIILLFWGGNAMALNLSSTVFTANGTIPKAYTCEGKDVSPPLQWTGAPDQTKSFALIMDDPDAPPGTWVHWVIYDIPADTKELAEALEKKESLVKGIKQGLVWGVDDFSKVGYFGPCPPPGKPHRYFFKLYALDVLLNLPAKASKPELTKAMQGHILAETSLVGLYGR